MNDIGRKIRRGVIQMAPNSYYSLADIASEANHETILALFNQFLDDFNHASDKAELIAEEPVWSIDLKRWRYDFAATAHKLANDYGLDIPDWVFKEEYIATKPYYAFNTSNSDFQTYLHETTPYEFASRNLFLGEHILTRA